jgi:hypothetical protein
MVYLFVIVVGTITLILGRIHLVVEYIEYSATIFHPISQPLPNALV